MGIEQGTVRVLHVDDSPQFTEITAKSLERETDLLSVETATGASTGLERLGEGSFDCVVSDYEMPGRDGVEFLRAVREEYPELPFILFTGKGSEEVAAEAISAGATDYIQKSGEPSQYTVLANRITNAVETYRTSRRVERANRRRRRTLERITDGFAELDSDLTFTDVNEQATEFAGRSREEMIGREYPELKAAWSSDRFVDAYREVLESGEPTTVAAQSDVRPGRWIEERIFPAEDGDGIFVYFRDITDQKEREQLQEIIIDISSRLITADEAKIDTEIEEALRQIGEFARADRCYVFEIYDDGSLMDNTHEWCRDGVKAHKPELQNLETGSFEWFMPKTKARETVVIPNRSELPAAAETLRETLESGNIQSILTIPLTEEEEVMGFIGLDWLEKQESWSDDTVDLLEVSGNIIANALRRKETIRRRKARERELERAKTIIENTTAIIYVKDREGRYTLVNSRYEEVLGMDREEIIGKTDFEIQSEEYARQVRENDRKALETGEPVETEEQAHRNGAVRTYISLKVPIFDGAGEPEAVCGISTDITEQKRREEELGRKNERLDKFVSVVSHDLRNPINTLDLSLELFERTGEQQHYERCERAVERMDHLVEDLLTLAKEGQRINEPEPVGLGTATEEVWATIETHDADLRVETDLTLSADESRLKQLLSNLLENAVDHAGPDVCITVGDCDDGFYVADDGPGITEDERETIFETGYSSTDGGTGFGLAIVTEIVEAHDWTISVVESQDGGARFEIAAVDTV